MKPRTRELPRAVVTFLRTPLVLKLIGANVVIAVITLATMMSMHTLRDGRIVAVLIGAVVLAQVVNSALVVVALRPIRALEETASRVSFGDMTARVPASPLADREVTRTSRALNHVLDELMEERDRIRRLAACVIRAQDDERARIARELHDATAQTMAGVVLQLSVAERSCPDEVAATRLEEIRQMAADALGEVRTLSHSVHPRVLQDLGLRAALDWLARRTRETSGLEVDVVSRGFGEISPTAASALYRVAQEALLNAVRHSSATAVELRLDMDGWHATLQVEDNGVGFQPRDTGSQPPGIGIFSMRERIALVDGVFDIESAPGRGCCIRATVPLDGVRP
jgi:signal transduction histidine kinase